MHVLDVIESILAVVPDESIYSEIYDDGEVVVRGNLGELLFHANLYDRDSSYEEAGKWFCRWFGYVEENE